MSSSACARPTTLAARSAERPGWEYVPCNLCEADDPRPRLQARDTLLGGSEVFTLVECRECGLVYLNPRPTQEAIGVYYHSRYFDAVGTGAVRSCWMRFLLDRLGRLAGQIEELPPGTVLDVGCGQGAYLKFFQQRGWAVWGIDPSPLAVERARRRGLRAFQGEMESVPLPESAFDLVLMRYTIENMHDPAGALRQVRRVLRPRGKLFLAAPAIDAPLVRWLGEFSAYVDAPRHLYFFTAETLTRMLERAGFRVLAWASVPWLGVFHDVVARRARGRLRAWVRGKLSGRLLWGACLPASLALAVIGLNRGNIELIAEKLGTEAGARV